MRVKITLSYDGCRYHGWQIQPNAITVQGELQNALEELFSVKVKTVGCSRTDAGVHARNFVCHADLPRFFPVDKLPFALNALLPSDIAVLFAQEVDDSFHARFSCCGKRYCYRLWNDRIRNPLEASYAGFWPVSLNAERMNELAQQFVGTHDFRAFMASGSEIEDTVREIYSFNVNEQDNMIFFTVEGNGFLYNMVRIMVGTLIYADLQKLDRSITDIIDSKDRTLAGITVSPQGLYLDMPFYD